MSGVPRFLLGSSALCALATLWAAEDLPARLVWLYAFKPLTTALLLGAALLALRAGAPRRYAGAVALGLGWSLSGDVFLMLPGDLFLAGLAAFLVAHVFYLIAFTAGVRLAARPLPFVAYAAAGAAMLAVLWRSASPRAAVVVYSLALCAMAAQALVRARVLRTAAAGLAALGAAIFVASDTLLAIDRFRGPLAHGESWVLATYFLAQTCIAASTVWSPPARARAHGATAAAALLLLLHAAAASGVERSEEVVLDAPGSLRLAGTLTLPDGPGPFPGVVTVTGSGARHRDGNRDAADPYRPFRAIAESLAGRGIATLRLDDRGAGGSTGDAARASGEDTASDTRTALEWLRRRPDIDAGALALLGHSYGGVIAPMVAADDRRLAALVLLGAPARSFRETMRYQHAWRIEHDPAIPPERRAAALAAAMAEQAANVARGEQAWRTFLQDRDPLPTIGPVTAPVLILQGETDRAVSPEDARMLERALREAGNRDVTRVHFSAVNHPFQRDPVGAREGYRSLPTQDLDPRVLATLGDWLSETLRRE